MSQFAAKSALEVQYDTYPFIAASRFTGKLKGKVIIITGASSGLGRASAHAFAAAGASVACVARRQAELNALVSELESQRGNPALAIVADVSDSANASSVVEKAEGTLGPIDILLNCAGITRYGTLAAEENFQTWWRLFEVNVRGPAALIHAVLPSMIKRKTGMVMTVASTSGSQDIPYNTAYASSKASVIKLHQDLAVELKRHNILSYSVHPGSVPTELGVQSSAVNMKSVEEEPEMQEALKAWGDMKHQTSELAANSFVALAAEERCKVLNGKYVDSEQDIEKVIEEAEKEGGGRVTKENLYRLKLDEL